MGSTRVILVDNGSFEPETTLSLRRLAHAVSKLIGQTVYAVSVLHSQKVDSAQLENKPAQVFADAVVAANHDGVTDLIVLPLFMGPSRAITEFLPEQFKLHAGPNLKMHIAPTLFGEDGLLREILIEQLKATGWKKNSGTILLCDHGSPAIEVTQVRNALAEEIRTQLQLTSNELIACSMERRPGDEYAFNEPLLETALQKSNGDCVVLMQFILPGRHAGAGGDVEEICTKHAPTGLKWRRSDLIGTNPQLPNLLAKRYGQIRR
jgi:sirohydrochlorin ferrochelatase